MGHFYNTPTSIEAYYKEVIADQMEQWVKRNRGPAVGFNGIDLLTIENRGSAALFDKKQVTGLRWEMNLYIIGGNPRGHLKAAGWISLDDNSDFRVDVRPDA